MTFVCPLISIGISILKPGALTPSFPVMRVFALFSTTRPVRVSITRFDLLRPVRLSYVTVAPPDFMGGAFSAAFIVDSTDMPALLPVIPVNLLR